MDMTLIYTVIGFALAGYSVIANDSIQTLGTFIASKKKWFKWYVLAGSASSVMIIALAWGWYSYDGDISYGRLTRIPYQEIHGINSVECCCRRFGTIRRFHLKHCTPAEIPVK